MGIGRFAYTPVLPAMQEATGFGAATAGWIAGWNYLGYLLGALAASMIAARESRNALLLACVAASILTTGAMGFTADVVQWCALRFASGLASAGVLVISSAIVLEALARASRPHLMGVHFSGVGIGIALSGIVVALGVGVLDWRGLWFALAGVSVALALVTLPLAQRHRAKGASLQSAAPAKERFSGPLLVASYFLEGLGYVLTGTFPVAIARQMPGIGGTFTGITAVILAFGGRISPRPARMIGLLTAAFGLGQMIGPVIAGWLAERQGGFDGSLLLAAGAVALARP